MNNKLKQILFVIGLFCFIVVVIFATTTEFKEVEPSGLASFVEIEKTPLLKEEPLWSQSSPELSSGDLQTSEELLQTKLKFESMRKGIENALGVRTAVVKVTSEYPPFDEFAIPLRDTKQIAVYVTLPSTWVMKRSSQIGSKEIAVDSLRTIIASVVPNAKISFHIVEVPPTVITAAPTQESYAKQIVLLVGLFGLLFASFIVDHRKSPTEHTNAIQFDNPSKEAKRILEMSYGEAVHAIDALQGEHKMDILQSIVSYETPLEDPPVIQVASKPELAESI